MRFTIEPELELFAESVRGALAGWEAPLEPVFGEWQDDRDDELAARLAAVGWGELWSDPELLGPAVAGGIELGRAVAPLCLVDEATLGVPLAVGGRVRHGEGRVEGGEREPTLDGTGTLRGVATTAPPIRPGCTPGAPSRSPTWRASPTARSRRRSSMRGRASSSARRSPRCRPCRRGSPMRHSRGTASCSRPGLPPTPRPASRATRSPGRAVPAVR